MTRRGELGPQPPAAIGRRPGLERPAAGADALAQPLQAASRTGAGERRRAGRAVVDRDQQLLGLAAHEHARRAAPAA